MDGVDVRGDRSVQLPGGDDAVEQAPVQRRPGLDRLPGQDELQQALLTAGLRGSRDGVRRIGADARLRERERRPLGGDREVGGRDEFEPAAVGDAVDGRDDGNREPFGAEQRLVQPRRQRLRVGPVPQRRERGDVVPGAERVARAVEDENAGLPLGPVERRGQRVQPVHRERVLLLGAVERDVGDSVPQVVAEHSGRWWRGEKGLGRGVQPGVGPGRGVKGLGTVGLGMERYDQLYRLYDEYDTATLRDYQEFVDLFPPVDSRVALDHWQNAREDLDERRDEIREAFPQGGETYAALAALATREQAFTALDLYTKYGRGVNVLVLDVDETLRSAGNTDNEIPRETLHLLTRFHEEGIPIVICTGQTLENVKGFLIQGLGNGVVHAGDVSIVYEAGTGVFTPGHGADTKQLLYEDLGDDIQAVFSRVRSRVLPDAPESLRRGCHLQGNEFNVTLKPNFETGSGRAHNIIEGGLVYLMDLLEESVGTVLDDVDDPTARGYARAFYAAGDPEIRGVLEATGEQPDTDADDVPDAFAALFERIDVAYYEADAAEIGSLELNKVVGVEAALDVLGVDDPFALVMGDSKSDLRVMRWAAENDAGIGAAPDHASPDVLDHVLATDELVFDRGDAAGLLRMAYALRRLSDLG